MLVILTPFLVRPSFAVKASSVFVSTSFLMNQQAMKATMAKMMPIAKMCWNASANTILIRSSMSAESPCGMPPFRIVSAVPSGNWSDNPDKPLAIFLESKLPKILNPSVVPIACNNCTVATPTPLCSSQRTPARSDCLNRRERRSQAPK